jgi:hypothetical protein
MKAIAQLFSFLFHPIFIPLYMLAVLFNLPVLKIQMINPAFRMILFGLLFINNIALPIISFYLLKKQRKILSVQMETAEERRTPYIILFGLYSITAVMLYRTSYLDPIIVFIPMAAAVTILAMIPLNQRFKISAHMTSIGSATAFLFLAHFYFEINLIMLISFVILAAGSIASSRLYLQAHDTKEIYSGYFLGLGVTLFVGSFYLFAWA